MDRAEPGKRQPTAFFSMTDKLRMAFESTKLSSVCLSISIFLLLNICNFTWFMKPKTLVLLWKKKQHCPGKLLGNVLSALCAAATILLAIKYWKRS